MTKYFDLDVRFWQEGLEEYSRALGFERICCFASQCRLCGIELKPSRVEDLRIDGKGKIILISSDKIELLLVAAKKRDADVLFTPTFQLSTALMRTTHEHEKAFEIPLSILLNSFGVQRAFLLSRIRFFLKLCNKYKVDFVITGRASTKYLMRTPREMVAIGELLGLTQDQAAKALSSIPLSILERKKLA
jgi:ribonuclease P/MRP protein subunit RPP1